MRERAAHSQSNWLFISIVLLWALASCSNATQTPPTAGTPATISYPAPGASRPAGTMPPSGYPAPGVADAALQTPIAPPQAPAPASGKASISGVLYSYTTMQVVPGTLFYLTQGIGEDHRTMLPILVGPNDQRGDIRGYSNDKGQFTLTDIPPGNYFLVVWAPYNWVPAENSNVDHAAHLIELTADQSVALEILYLSWP